MFEEEPLSSGSYLREHPLCILGSHNASNTVEAVRRTNEVAIQKLLFLGNCTDEDGRNHRASGGCRSGSFGLAEQYEVVGIDRQTPSWLRYHA